MNLLQQLEQQIKTEDLIEFDAEAKQLERVDVLDLIGDSCYSIVKAEFGVGKTYSLRSIASRSLYVTHRKSLVADKGYFKKAICINSLSYQPIEKVIEDYEYIILDEILGCFDSLCWDQVDYIEATRRLQFFEGKIIALDRDATQTTTELLSKITGKEFKYFVHKTGSRDKYVALTKEVSDVLKLAKKYSPGIKLILCDTKTKAEELYRTKLDGDKFLVTGDNSSEITEILQKAEQSNDAWVFASPAIQEGVSIESEKFNFTAYIQSGCPNLLRPIHKGLQGLHRVRNSKAVRVVCILGWEQEEIIDEKSSLEKLYTEYVQRLSLVEEYIKHTLAGNSPYDFFDEKCVGFSIYNHHRYLTSLQNSDAKSEWVKELRASGYEVYPMMSEDGESEFEVEEVSLEHSNEEIIDSCNSFRLNHELLTHYKTDESIRRKVRAKGDIINLRCRIGCWFGVEASNDVSFIEEFRRKHYRKVKVRQMLYTLDLDGFKGSLWYERKKAKYVLVYNLLKDLIGDEDWNKLGKPDQLNSFGLVKKEVYNHKLFKKLKQEFNKESAKDERWFWQECMKTYFGFTCESFGKGRSKYRVSNEITFWDETA